MLVPNHLSVINSVHVPNIVLQVCVDGVCYKGVWIWCVNRVC